MAMKTGMLFQPCLDLGMIVRTVIVHNHVDCQVFGSFMIDLPQKPPEFDIAMPRITRTDDLSLQNIQRREQAGSTVTFVIVRHRPAAAFLHRQAGLRPVERLDLGLLSSTHRTTALSGGFMYTPTTSVNFSTNRLSLESLNPSTRCGCNPCASQMRQIVALLTPMAWAIARVDQWVDPGGVVCKVASTISLIFSADKARELRPWGASSASPAGPNC